MDENMLREMEDRELEVDLTDYPYDVTARYEVCAGVEIVARDPNDDADPTERFVQAIKDLRHGLALANVVGKMRFILDLTGDGAAARRAMDAFTDEDLAITWGTVARAHEEEAERAKQAMEHFQARLEFLRAQQREEGEDITFGEARERHQEGTEQMRRMVEGDEDE